MSPSHYFEAGILYERRWLLVSSRKRGIPRVLFGVPELCHHHLQRRDLPIQFRYHYNDTHHGYEFQPTCPCKFHALQTASYPAAGCTTSRPYVLLGWIHADTHLRPRPRAGACYRLHTSTGPALSGALALTPPPTTNHYPPAHPVPHSPLPHVSLVSTGLVSMPSFPSQNSCIHRPSMALSPPIPHGIVQNVRHFAGTLQGGISDAARYVRWARQAGQFAAGPGSRGGGAETAVRGRLDGVCHWRALPIPGTSGLHLPGLHWLPRHGRTECFQNTPSFRLERMGVARTVKLYGKDALK